MTRDEAVTRVVRHLLGICKVIIVYFGVQAAFKKIFPESVE